MLTQHNRNHAARTAPIRYNGTMKPPRRLFSSKGHKAQQLFLRWILSRIEIAKL
ncbi:MAG: hypothetical protein LBV12_10075 [Puniceicoccales bacterium]|jgi:hypothetical protein|nr:hypothetical protein [Puniceicoccales bacterium]